MWNREHCMNTVCFHILFIAKGNNSGFLIFTGRQCSLSWNFHSVLGIIFTFSPSASLAQKHRWWHLKMLLTWKNHYHFLSSVSSHIHQDCNLPASLQFFSAVFPVLCFCFHSFWYKSMYNSTLAVHTVFSGKDFHARSRKLKELSCSDQYRWIYWATSFVSWIKLSKTNVKSKWFFKLGFFFWCCLSICTGKWRREQSFLPGWHNLRNAGAIKTFWVFVKVEQHFTANEIYNILGV